MGNFIFGKVKRKQSMFRIIETENSVYDMDKLNLSGVDYNPMTLIEDDELYKVSSFSTTEFALPFILGDLDSVNHDQITREDLKKLSFICTVQQHLYFFQVINSSFYVSKKWFSIDELTLENDKPIITINPFADAIYDKQEDNLYFKKLTAVQKIFKGMDQLYREATNEETQGFLGSEFLDVSVDFSAIKVSVPNRRRIALVKETLKRFTDHEKQAIYEYISDYSQVRYSDGKFRIDSDDDLKFVLWGIEQRYYTTPIGSEKRVANSIISI
jgi:hypothetical protein